MVSPVLRTHSSRWPFAFLPCACIVLCIAFSTVAHAQATAAINGTVTDSSGAVIPGTELVLHNRATNLDRTTTSNSVGAYVIPNVQPGNYDLRAKKSGFAPAVDSNITLVVNQTATHNFTLTTGSVNEVVVVKGEAATLETSTAELGNAIVKQEVNDLPLNGRNFTQMLNLTPGVSTVNVSQNSTGSGGVWSNPIGNFSYPSVNGQTNRSNLFLLDGVNNQGSFGSTYAVPPIIDDIQEFKVQSHNDDASFGGALGGIINVVTKSGTAAFHGSAWEFLRNTSFDARNPFVPSVTPFQQNQFGATAGGPVFIPGHKPATPKTFFFASYEGFRNHTTAQNFFTTPTAAELTGDLSTVPNQIFNPFSTVPNASSPTGFSNAPFMCDAAGSPLPATNGVQGSGIPCNKIPSSMLNPDMLTYAQKLFPSPNLFGNPNFNGLDTTKNITQQDEGGLRLDHQFSERSSIWARYSGFWQPVSGSGGFTGLARQQQTRGYNVGVTYTHTFSSSALMELLFGRNSVNIDQGANYANAPASLGGQLFSPNFAGNFIGGVSMIPDVTILGYIGNSNPSAHGASQVDNTHVSDIWQWGGSFTKNYLHHTFRVGANFASNNASALYLNSSVLFSAANTANAANISEGGDALASFLLGVPNSASRRDVVETQHGGWVDGFYFMDEWKATPKLSVNLGLRYDITFMPYYGDNQHQNNMVGDLDAFRGIYILAHTAPPCSVTNAAPCIPTPNGTLPANVIVTPLSNGAIYHNDYTNWQPRIGFAYQLRANTVLRAGYGRFFDNWAAITQTAQNFEGTWPSLGQLGASNLNALTSVPTATAEDPFSLGSGSALPPPTPFNQVTWYADPYLKRPYADQWNFGVQQQVGSNTVLTANYVGSHGGRLDLGPYANTALTPGPGNPQDRAPFPFITPTPFDRSTGRSSYNALQVSMDGRSVHGLTYLISYTWSKAMDIGCTGWYGVEGCSIQDPYNMNKDRGPAATDLPQILSASWVYQLPFGQGRKYTSSNGILNHIIGGWGLNGILSLSSGQPYDVGVSGDIANTGNVGCCSGYYERLNLVGDATPAHQSPAEWLNPAAFQVPAQFTFGTLGRDALRSDWFKNLDLSLFRQFPITERTRLEFRFEGFNVTNTPVWAIPDRNFSDGSRFGVVSSTANTARQLQLGLKLYW